MTLAFNQTGSVPKIAGSLGFSPTANYGIQSPPKTSVPNSTPALTQGSNTGMAVPLTSGINSSSQQKVVTTTPTGSSTTIHPAQSNPSVLAQQQALNKLGAGLVEDGIAGPKTSAAIAKYGTGTTDTSKTDTSKTDTSGSSTGFTPNTQSLDTTSNANRVLNSGNQTPQEQQAYQGLLSYGQGQESPEVTQARQNLIDAQKQFAKQTSEINQSGTWTSRALGEQGQANQQNAGVLSALQGGVSNALTSQGQQIGALGNANSAAQTTASRGTNTAGTVFNSGLVSPTTQGQAAFSPLNGYQGDSSNQFGDANDPASAARAQAYKGYNDKYYAGLGNINQATAKEPDIINTLTQFGLNTQPVSAIQNINELISGQTSAPGQQQLAALVSDYIKNLGIDPATATNIAHQQSGTMIDLLNNLKTIATKNNDANKTTADSLKNQTSSGSSTGGFTDGQKSNDGSLIYKNGKWQKA